jgi:dihydrofolate synthase / folylpolyglutamate synthase
MSRYTASNADIRDQFSYLEALSSRGIRTDLSSVREALSLLDHPERKVPTVIVGGTNGKGSTVAMIGGIIRHAEYSVGCYYSPHIIDVSERINYNGRSITPAEMADLIGRVRREIEGRVELTYFEFLTVSAYCWFSEKKADLSVMEVGMGGRFDATNVADPLASVITTVSLDHTQYLGDSEEAIALEKVQIVPPGGILISGRVKKRVETVLRDYVREVEARVMFLGKDFRGIGKAEKGPEGTNVMQYIGPSIQFNDIHLSFAGRHQVDNAAVALAVIELLGKKGFSISERAVREGIESTRLPGRIQRVSESPEVIVDVAHNPAGAKALADHIGTLPKKRTALVVGMMADKDIAGFLKMFDAQADMLVLASPHVERAASIQTLNKAVDSPEKRVRASRSVGDAVDWAEKAVGSDGRVVITGSFYTVQEAMERIGQAQETH